MNLKNDTSCKILAHYIGAEWYLLKFFIFYEHSIINHLFNIIKLLIFDHNPLVTLTPFCSFHFLILHYPISILFFWRESHNVLLLHYQLKPQKIKWWWLSYLEDYNGYWRLLRKKNFGYYVNIKAVVIEKISREYDEF